MGKAGVLTRVGPSLGDSTDMDEKAGEADMVYRRRGLSWYGQLSNWQKYQCSMACCRSALMDNLFWKRKKNLYSPSACLNCRGSWGLETIVPGMNLNTGGGFLGGGWLFVGAGSRTRVVTLEQGKVVSTTVEGVSGQLSSQPQVEAGRSNQEDIELDSMFVALLCYSEESVDDKV